MGPDGPHLSVHAGVSTTVHALDARDSRAWDEFVRACPAATFFHLSGWRAVIERSFGHRTHYLFARRGDEIVGVLPLTEIDSLFFGHALISNAFCVYGGIAARDEAAFRALDDAAQRLARDLGVDWLEYRHRTPRHPDWPRQDIYYTFRKALLPEREANLLAIPRKQRAMVRKGMKHGLAPDRAGSLDDFFSLYADNVHRHGTPALPKRYFAELMDTFREAASILVVRHAGRPVSAVLTFWFRDEVLPYYAGDLPIARELAANDFKYWALMEQAVERGCRVFDYGRSKRGTGQFDFKKNWGFTPEPLAYEFDLVTARRLPQNNPANPKFRLFIAAWKRLPRGLATRLGPFIVKDLG